MSGKDPRLNPLKSRKQLLLAESELNRAQLAGDVVALAEGVRALADRARSFGSITSSAALLVAGLAALRHGRPADVGSKPSKVQTILRSAGLIGSSVFMLRRTLKARSWRSIGHVRTGL